MKETKKGIIAGFLAYILWGIIPMYWKLLPTVGALDILAYRVIWSFVFMLIYILVTKKTSDFLNECKQLWQDKKKLGTIILAAIFISVNWFTFIYTVNQGRVTEASLGYYMNPLVNVLLATLVLKEPLGSLGKIACGFAFIGVILLTIQTGTIPVSSLVMAFSFSIYGLIKKGLSLSSYTGLTIETLVILPAALIYLVGFSPAGFMTYQGSTNLLLMGAGVVTAIPLLLFAESAKRISYIILGFIQYVNPTMMLLLAIFVFNEPYTSEQFFAFSFIWVGIGLFTYATLHTWRKEIQFENHKLILDETKDKEK
ncbi:protein RarD [Enterococcus phoeniculicola]|jgi:chloramphenicol-sensitive protein RarD|uniref:Protein RarD n=1 Tax=Enterococcus phoeniculicola ATCC BAA-412 TaxID=1158610 RepID=R3WKM0_9ENTE|nr:EamA family transporter RarD [Enterococcus phoeniculicola]EOL42425.1 protein RarD [Enterococcus phoeniculicola ATCC BAA-412]EOT79296.1 protein RarD [Enterococcus phoeniculicola ATCC BAA-412]OJG73165.1 protein RarD [Enterococcus phoeniculicola]